LKKESDSDNIPVFFSLCGGGFVLQFPSLFFSTKTDPASERSIEKERDRPMTPTRARRFSRPAMSTTTQISEFFLRLYIVVFIQYIGAKRRKKFEGRE
jgi:hypothetical protein